jgi:hypothetical protein
MLQKLTDSVSPIDFEAVRSAAEFPEQAKIVKRGADEQKLNIELPACLPAELVRPEKDAMGVVEQKRSAELAQKAGRFARQFAIGDSSLHVLKLNGGSWHRQDHTGAAKGRRLVRGVKKLGSTRGCGGIHRCFRTH